MMTDPFERFYTTRVKLLTIEKPQGYDRSEVNITELDSIMADVQPYNGGLALNEYGLSKECQKRMFCKSNKYLTEGNYAEFDGKRYRIVYAVTWKTTGVEALLQEVSE